MIKPLLTAIRTLTIIPIPGEDTKVFSYTLPFFPIVGLILGGIVYGLFISSKALEIPEPGIVVLIVLIIETIITGGLHIDGLGDISDGFGSGKSGERLFDILKDSRMGTYGICAIVFDIMLKALCWYILFIGEFFHIIIFSLIFSRNIQVLYLLFLPNARKASLLTTFKNSSIFIKLSSLLTITSSTIICGYFIGWNYTLIIVISSIIGALIFGLLCIKKMRGITGDCLGAVNEITELIVLISGIIIFL